MTLAAVAGALAVTTAHPAGADAALYPASGNGLLAYSSVENTDSVGTIWADGTRKAAVENALGKLGPLNVVKGWTADGNRIILTGPGQTSIVDLNPWTRTTVRTVPEPNGLTVWNPSVSPDGQTYAYGTTANGIRLIDGDDVMTSFMEHSSAGTSWSNTGPSGDRLAWINDENDGEVNDDPGVFVSNSAQTSPTGNIHMVDSFEFYPEHLSISKNGLYLAYDYGNQDNGKYDIRIGAAENGGPVADFALNQLGTEEKLPAMSPDGTKVAFVSDRAMPGSLESIYIANRDGTNLTPVPNTVKPAGYYTGLSWQPGTAPNLASIGVYGATEVGMTLTPDEMPGQTDVGTAPMTYSYEWQRCDDSPVPTNCVSINGGTNRSYTATSADLGKRLRVIRSATNPAGSDTEPTDVTIEPVSEPDTTPPGVPTITTKPGSRSNATNPTFAWTGAEPGGTYQCSLDGAAFTSCTSGSSFAVSGEIEHSFKVRQVDMFNNVGDPAEHKWTLDTTLPGAPTVTSKPAAKTSSSSARFTFTGDEVGGSFECRVGADGASWSPCSSPTDITGMSEGDKRFSIRQVDAAGNAGPADITTWKVNFDVTAPGVPTITTKPELVSNDPSPVFAWTGAEAGGTFQCSIDQGAWTACTSGSTFPVTGEQEHSFRVRHVDAAENIGDPAEYKWTLDTVAPGDVNVTKQPAALTKSPTATIEFDGLTPGAKFQCREGKDPWTDCTSPLELTGLTDGDHSYAIRQIDAAGNTSEDVALVEWTLDLTPPAKPSLDDNDSSVLVLSHPRWFSGEDDATFECQLDDGAWAACTSPTTVSGYDTGEHTFRVRQTDKAGNTSLAAEETFNANVDGPNKPAITDRPAPFTQDADASFGIAATDERTGSYECRLDGGAWAACTAPVTFPGLDEGEHTFEVRALTHQAIPGEAASYTWTIDATKPAAPLVKGLPQGETTSTSVDLEFGGEPDGKVQYRLDGGEWLKGHHGLKADGLKLGKHVLELRQYDAAGNLSDVATYTWTIVAPKADAPAPVAVTPPAPVAEAPKAEAPKATTTVVPRSAPKAETPKLTAIVGTTTGGSGSGTSSAASIVVKKDGVGVGCSITGTVLTACKVDLYVDRASGATAVAAARVLVGTGTVRVAEGSKKMQVDVQLNATGRELMRKSPEGLKVKVDITGTPVKGAALKATGVATLVRQTTKATVGGFAVRSAQLTPAAKRQLAKLAKQVKGTAVAIRVVGHTDGSSDDNRYLDGLGKRRAQAVATFLRAHGVKATATLATRGDKAPRASNATKAGRAKNRRVQLTITR